MKFTSLLLCIKTAQKPILTPMRRVGKTCNPQCLCGFISLGVIIPHSSILLTFPLAVPDSALTPIVAQSSTAALPYARCISHCERSRRHLLLSYIHFSLNYIVLYITSDKRVTRFTQASKFPILETPCGSYYLRNKEIYTD